MLQHRDVGHRVVVRRVVGSRAGRPLFSDALGELTALTDTHLSIATARGELRVPLAEVHRAKRVPPARRPTATAVAALEHAADEAWPAPVRDRLGDWLLRAADGWTGRANSALPVGDPDRPLDAALDAVEAWYAARGLPARVNVPLPLAAPVNAALDSRGWSTAPPVLVQTAPLATVRESAGPSAGPDRREVRLAETPSDGWLALAAARKTGLPPAARHVLTAVDQVRFAHVYAPEGTDELLAAARGTVTGNGRWLGLSLVEVVPSARRGGLARLMMAALAEWAAGLGATEAFLQVVRENEAAVSLYRGLGFRSHHTYLTRIAPN
ncbi:GNAT family N-acetyltransferase [Plantactinospora sp. GCM10030261]|uniref:GNAT family N-acetyltransferase n=1 Tax=Plantactinospora sp. GCM10030261 TaxID=3273420 RepID=UPI00360BC9D9